MAASLLQTSPTLRTQASGATSTLAYSSNLTAGSLSVLVVTNFTGSITSVSGSTNGAYTKAVGFFDGGNNSVELWYKANVSAGAETLTITPSTTSGNYISARAQEWAGMVTTAPLDQTGSAGALSVSTAGATSQADELAFTAAVADAGSANCTWGLPAGYTAADAEQDSNNFTGYSWGYRVLSAAGTQSVTHTAAVVGDSIIATFKVAGGSPIFPDPPSVLPGQPAWAGIYGRGGGRDLVRMAANLPSSGVNELIGQVALFGAATSGSASVSGITLTTNASLTFGGVSADSQASGQTLTATASLISGTASASSSATANGTTLTATASLIAGSASGTASASVSGVTLTASTSLTAGTLTADSAVSGLTLTATASLIAGTAAGGSAGTVNGQTLTVSASIIAGSLAADSLVAGVTLTGGTVSLIPGTVAADSSASGTTFTATTAFFPGSASAGSSGATVNGQVLTTTVFFLAGLADNASLPRFPVRDRARNIVPRKYK